MKKRLCLFMMLLLLYMSVSCGQATPQTPEIPVTETSQTAAGTTTAVDANDRDNLHADPVSVEYDASPDNTATDLNDEASDKNEGNSPDDGTATDLYDEASGENEVDSPALPEDGSYTTKEDVALYIHLYGHLPPNFITKKEAEKLGWSGGSLEPFAPGMCIGGNRFGNYEGLLPEKEGRTYTECDIDTLNADKRGAKRIVFSNDGLIYYTEDHYNSFELLYGEADP